MSRPSDTFRKHHQQLLAELTGHSATLVKGHPDADPAALVTFLESELLPHAVGEERHLYPAVDPLVKAHGRATATMSIDHRHIEALIREIARLAEHLKRPGTPAAGREPLRARLRDRALQLDILFRVHLEKEEEVYLPLFETYLSETEQERVLGAMHEG